MKVRSIFKNILNLQEVFDTKIPVSNWEEHNGCFIGNILIDGAHYQIVIDVLEYQINKSVKTAMNVAFDKIENGARVNILTNDNLNTSKIFGAILNAVTDKIDQYHFDAILFTAANNIEKRMQLYNKIARWIGKKYGVVIPDIPIGIGVCTIVCTQTITEEEVEILKKLVANK